MKLQNIHHKVRLHSHDVKYGSGSGQQSVTGTDVKEDVNSHWALKGKKTLSTFSENLTDKYVAFEIFCVKLNELSKVRTNCKFNGTCLIKHRALRHSPANLDCKIKGRHGEFEPGKAQYSTPNFFMNGCFL